MLLSDMGADVVRIDRPGPKGPGANKVLDRGRRVVQLDLKDAGDLELGLGLIAAADALIEGFRPGVMERLGLGPDVALQRNRRLVYGRMTGWGQDGPLAHAAGHDINYIAITGALHAMGRKDSPPAPPLNLVGDFGGGALYLAMGVCAALFEARGSGQGQVIDCAMCDGAASLMAMSYGMRAAGWLSDEREANLLDGGAHFYDVYECADGAFVALGAIEPQFYGELLAKIGLSGDPDMPAQLDRASWPAAKVKIAAAMRAKTRAEWQAILEGGDACFAPVLSMGEAPAHAHNQARGVFIERDGVVQPNAAPRFSRTPSAVQASAEADGGDRARILSDWGLDPHRT
jgi:alpha-methylacyl-CoA racemase